MLYHERKLNKMYFPKQIISSWFIIIMIDFQVFLLNNPIENTKTTSMEDVNTGVFEYNI